MSEVVELSWNACRAKARDILFNLEKKFPDRKTLGCWPIPNGGIPAALIVCEVSAGLRRQTVFMCNQPHEADIIIDDVIDSGKTRDQYQQMLSRPVYALYDKLGMDKGLAGKWISFPWERIQKQDTIEDNILRILQFIGENPERPGLLETPKRVVKSYQELFSGYKDDPNQYIKIFEETASDAMIVLKDVEFYSHCEHHMAPFFGKADLAYIPSFKTTSNCCTPQLCDTCGDDCGGRETISRSYRVLGASKLSRIFDSFARRLQIQERIGAQFTEFLMSSDLQPLGAACRIEATHFCMCSRGIGKQHSKMVTSSLEGVFRKSEVRQEFLSLIKE